jgi:HKD family nuclease
MTGQLDLHEALRRYSYDHAFLCTFNFQAEFFEGYCLEQFDSFVTNNGITVIMDGRELDRLIAGPSSQWPQQANVRYLLHAARPKGRFHPKVYLLASRTRGLLVVGSANLTRAGLTRNAELARSFAFELGKRELALPLFQSARAFLGEVATRWPAAELDKRLAKFDSDIPWLSGVPAKAVPIRFLHNLSTPLLPQLVEKLESPVQDLSVVSPFFDEEPVLLDWLQQQVNPGSVTLFTKNSAPTLTPAWFKHPLMESRAAKLLFSNWSENDHARQLHAKALALSHGKSVRLAFGSANFTRAALLATPKDGNVEVILALDDVPRRSIDVRALFDPSGAAKEEALVPFERPATEPEAVHHLRLVEATLEDSAFRCLLGAEHTDALDAVLLFHDGGTLTVSLEGAGADRRAELNDVVAKRADRGSTVVLLRAPGGAESNRVLLVNLKDLATGGALRKERRVRDAQRSADQFASALLELLRLKDTDPLQTFLTFCDIPLAGVARLRGTAREPLTLDQVQTELRRLGEHNLREYGTLHAAVVGFCERHIARLSRHARDPSVDAIPGCMHIIRSVAGVLATQIERLLAGLAHVTTLTIDAWYDYRTKLDHLLRVWVSLLRVVHTEWLLQLESAYAEKEIKEAAAPDLAPLQDLARLFVDVRARTVAAIKKFRVQTHTGQQVEPPIVNDNTISPQKWKRWVEEVSSHQRALDALSQ